ncbi:amino acid--tRNA ligase-related protein [Spirochaetota bacterium]
MNRQAISESLSNFQAALNENGETLNDFFKKSYLDRWLGDDLYHVMAIRTTFVNAMHNFLTEQGLFNMERVSVSPITDPLAHDVEHSPTISYKGHEYKTTHSMIYSKFLACFNPETKGVYVDSPNIRLEIESPVGKQRNKYLIDFSQMDIEMRRNRNIGIDEYKKNTDKVIKIIKEDYEKALLFFEELIIHALSAVVEKNSSNVKKLGIALEVPKSPFPRFRKDDAVKKYGAIDLEKKIGDDVKTQFFWITGLMRENYDLIYPYLKPDGSKVSLSEFTSDMIYNYDICAQSLDRKTNKYNPAYEVFSGAVREWLYEPIVERLIDNKVIPVRPEIVNGNIVNINELGGYGPFLLAVSQKDKKGNSMFPETFGGGIGVERTIFALCLGEKIKRIDDVTFFGKNPDSHPMYLF